MDADEGSKHPVAPKAKRRESFGETLRTLIIALFIGLAIRTFAYEPFNIPSGSMIPTLLVGDYIFVSKLSYGYSRFSFPFGVIPIDGRIFGDEPERGDVAVFRKPGDTSTDFIKRIIGLPGDRLQMRAGILYVNGEPVKRRRIADYPLDDTSRSRMVPQYIQTLPEGRDYHVIERQGDTGPLDNTPEYQVPDGHFFALGDNRDGSHDSRILHDVGYIPYRNLIGRADFIFFSTNGTAAWWEFWKWPFTIRYNRLFDGID